MIERQYPYIDENGSQHYELVKHYSNSGNKIVQIETGKIFEEAIDLFPCNFTYQEIVEDEIIDVENESVE